MGERKGDSAAFNGHSALAALILCGGKSSRMGRDKAAIELAGRPLLARVVAALAPLARDVIVVAAPDQALPALAGVTVVRDDAPHHGPLAGLARGARALAPDIGACFVCATDHPALHPSVIRALLRRCEGREAALFVRDGQRALLCGAYARSAVERAAPCLDGGARSVKAWVATLDVREVTAEELLADPAVRQGDPRLASFDDVDDEAALARLAR